MPIHRVRKFMKGYHAVARPRLRPDIGRHNAQVMAIWPNWIEAVAYCIRASEYYYDWGDGISDCTIEPYEGMVDDWDLTPDTLRRIQQELDEDKRSGG